MTALRIYAWMSGFFAAIFLAKAKKDGLEPCDALMMFASIILIVWSLRGVER